MVMYISVPIGPGTEQIISGLFQMWLLLSHFVSQEWDEHTHCPYIIISYLFL